MAIIPVNIENLKPNKEYIVTVRSKNNDVNVVSPYTDSVRFFTPTDSTIPGAPTNLVLAASFLNVLFKYTDSVDEDTAKYEYELYKQEQIESVGGQYQVISSATPLTPHRTGFVQTNVFLVSVDDNSTTTSTSSTTNPVKYYGRVRSIDSAGNIGSWTSIVASGDTPLIDEEFIGSLTAAKITAGTIGAHEIILTQPGTATTITSPDNKAILRSSDYNGSYNNTTDTWSAGTAGWIISGDGRAEFNNIVARGELLAGAFSLNSNNYWNSSTIKTYGDYSDFRVGDSTRYILWDNSAGTLSITGTINAVGGTFSGSITASGTISGGTIAGATITGSTLTTAASGNRVNINSNDITIYYTGENLASINISGNTFYTNEITATGTLKIRGLSATTNNYMQVGYYPGAIYQGVRLQGLDGVTAIGVNDSDTGSLGHLVVTGSSGNEANLTLLCSNSHIQLRAGNNNSILYLRRANDTAYADLELNILRNQGAGIIFAGSTVGGGSANQMGMSWANPNILGTVDNVVSAVLGTVSDRRVKTNIETFTSGLSELQNLRVVKYNPYVVTDFTEDGPIVSGVVEQAMIGLIADEVEQVAPWLVQGTASKRELQSVNYALITPLLINAIKEINQRLEVLENK